MERLISVRDVARPSDVVGNDERRPVAAVPTRQQTIRFVVANDLLGVGIEPQLAAETVRRVCEMNQRARYVAFSYRGVEIRGAPAPHAADEVGEVIAARPAARSGALLRSEPALVGEGVFIAGRQVPFRSVEDVADRVAPSQQSASNPRFVVRDPMPDIELEHLSRAARVDELERARERVRRLLGRRRT